MRRVDLPPSPRAGVGFLTPALRTFPNPFPESPFPRNEECHAEHEEPPIATPPANNEPRINDRIRAREVRLVGADGSQIGIKPLPEALAMAREQDLDLVEVAAMANPPVCRIMDYGKFKYEAAQQAKESRSKSVAVAIKEMKYRPKIGIGDFRTKTNQVEKFLGQGHKVKVTIMFRGREMQHPELGQKILDRVAVAVAHYGRVEVFPKLDGRNMIMVLAPDKRARAAHEKALAEQAAALVPAVEDVGADATVASTVAAVPAAVITAAPAEHPEFPEETEAEATPDVAIDETIPAPDGEPAA
ncbi:MAG: translation initiation factor IF-3 [Acidimicrobiales bacterium]